MTKLHEIDHPEKKVDKNVVFAHYYMCMATLDSIEICWLPVLSDRITMYKKLICPCLYKDYFLSKKILLFLEMINCSFVRLKSRNLNHKFC